MMDGQDDGKIAVGRRTAIAWAMTLAVAACTARPLSTATLTAATITVPPTPPRHTPSPTLPPSPGRTLFPPCREQSGSTEQHSLVTAYLPVPLRFLVYLPPCYPFHETSRYPVLYLFHGLFYDETQWQRLGALDTADRLIASGEVPPFLIVLPYDPSSKEPDQYGFADAISNDLIPYIDTHYRTCPQNLCRAIGGLSRGAGWALHLGLTRPDLFSAVGAHSPAPFWADWPHFDDWLMAIPAESLPRLWLDIGKSDPLRPSAEQLETLLNATKVPHEWYLFQGEHTEEYWRAHLELYLRWYAAGWH